MDTATQDGYLRSLHFNDRYDYVQSSVRVSVAGLVDHSRPPPTVGETGTVVSGLGLAVASHILLTPSWAHASHMALRIAVVGAGACSLPAFLHTALPAAQVDAVELSAAVCAAARDHFGVAELEASSSRFRLHEGCGFEWLEAAPPDSADILVIDMEFGEIDAEVGAPQPAVGSADGAGDAAEAADATGPLLAPPRRFLRPEVLARCAKVLAPGGVLAVNALGSALEVEKAAMTLGAFAETTPPASVAVPEGMTAQGERLVQRFLFCAPRGNGDGDTPGRAAVSRLALRTALDALGRDGVELLDDAAWAESWKNRHAWFDGDAKVNLEWHAG